MDLDSENRNSTDVFERANKLSNSADVQIPIRVAILGGGNVGAALVELLDIQRDTILATSGIGFEVVGVAVRNTSIQRKPPIPEDLLTADAEALIENPAVDLVVEVIGGVEPARSLIMHALKSAKPVVTANKELLANFGDELYQTAEANGVDLLFEAAVAGAIPIVRTLRESLLGEDIQRLMGIVNGTTNFIMTQMSEKGASYGDALAEAQHLGYAERDPTADVEGYDAAAKVAIMASIAFGVTVNAGDVYREGVSSISTEDIDFATHFGYTLKLLAIAECFADNGATSEVGVTVYPAMVANDHPLATVKGSFNAVFIESAAAGDLMFYGRGAGGTPTASAVLGDMMMAAANLVGKSYRPVPQGPRAVIRPVDELRAAFYINVEVDDSSGVLAAVAKVFAQNNVSIRLMEQHSAISSDQPANAENARLAFITHGAQERDVRRTLKELRNLSAVVAVHSTLRVIETQ